MIKKLSAAAFALVFVSSAFAVTYPGNTASGFGGAVGQGSLELTDDGTTLSGTFTKGPGAFNNVLVLYLDTTAGGFADTSTLADANDGLRRAISGFDGGTNRSVLTMPAGFDADFAIALGPLENFGGLWTLAAGGNNSLIFEESANLDPLGTDSAAVYTFSISLAEIGIGAGQSFDILGTYISNSGFRSDEFIAGNGTGTTGWNPFTGTAAVTYTTVPEPSSFALLAGPALLGFWFYARRRRAS